MKNRPYVGEAGMCLPRNTNNNPKPSIIRPAISIISTNQINHPPHMYNALPSPASPAYFSTAVIVTSQWCCMSSST